MPEAEIGDVIVYDWEGDGVSDHAAIITNIAPGQYPEVSEWSAYDGRNPAPYVRRGWTWSERSQLWLQQKFPRISAFLLHIDATAIGEY
jgi:hypothetical protein